FERDVFDLGIRALAILLDLFPTLRNGAVVVEEIEPRVVPVSAHDLVDAGVPNAVEEGVECCEHAFRAGLLGCRCCRCWCGRLLRRSLGRSGWCLRSVRVCLLRTLGCG